MGKIIAVAGLIDSGKGTVSEYLAEHHDYRKLAFADKLKDAVAAIFGWPRHLLEGDTRESRLWRETEDTWWSARLGYTVTPRLMLQYMGTEAGRNVFGQDIWIASVEKAILNTNNINHVLTDLRFPNEADLVKRLFGINIRVERGERPDWYDTAVNAPEKMPELYPNVHPSECSLVNYKFDYVIDNNGTLEDLYSKIENILREYK